MKNEEIYQKEEDSSWYRDYESQRDRYTEEMLMDQYAALGDYMSLKNLLFSDITIDMILDCWDDYAKYWSRYYFSKHKYLTMTFKEYAIYHSMPIYHKAWPKIFLFNPHKSYYSIHSKQHAEYMKGNIVDQLAKEYNQNNC